MTWPTLFDKRLDEYDAMELPGQQLAASHAYTPLDHLLNLDIKAAPGCQRLTGIMASMGRSTYDIEVMEKMMEAGMNIAFLNMSFGLREEHVETIKLLRQAARNYSVTMARNYPLSIAIRLSGKKIRTGRIAESYGESVELKTGDVVRLTTDETYRDRCSTYTVYVDFMYLSEQLKKGDMILLDNETVELKVEMISATTLTCKIERGGFLGSFKDVFIPNVALDMPNYSDKDKLDIEMAVSNQVDMVIASFVNTSEGLLELRSLLGDKGKKIAIIANIQTVQGFRNFDAILQVTDAIMITRQELGSDITPKKLVIAQKNMIARANRANIPVCISGHLLSSMRQKRIPLRAELLDVANCILDGADVLVLCPETAVGYHPVETIASMTNACKEAEACIWTKQVFSDFIDKTALPCDQVTGAAMAGVLASQRVIAAAIIVVTTSGKSAQVVAKYRPRCPIIAVTRYPPIARQLHLWRGIIPLIYEDSPDIDWSQDLDKRVKFCLTWAMEKGFIRVGDPVVVVSGWRQGTGYTNTMRIIYAEPDPAYQAT
ncbi:pyruvate kinase-like [Anticarsia gemmatalis]|uniref:pyruvate kinase-like n=1 Tax=Anticarsia gemmatalis TaxID=129554 RepID=UPI003F757366